MLDYLKELGVVSGLLVLVGMGCLLFLCFRYFHLLVQIFLVILAALGSSWFILSSKTSIGVYGLILLLVIKKLLAWKYAHRIHFWGPVLMVVVFVCFNSGGEYTNLYLDAAYYTPMVLFLGCSILGGKDISLSEFYRKVLPPIQEAYKHYNNNLKRYLSLFLLWLVIVLIVVSVVSWAVGLFVRVISVS